MRQKTARAVLFVYFLLTGLTAAGMEGHAAEHARHGNHGAQHAGFLCLWMCASSTFVHTADPQPTQRFSPSFSHRVPYAEPSPRNVFVFSFYARPPPFRLV